MKLLTILALALAGGLLLAQSSDFEGTTIRLTPINYIGATGPGGSPGRLAINNYTVRQMMKYAYDLHPDQIVAGPHWTDSVRFDIETKLPEGITGEANIRLMVQKLMADRFALIFHRETRELPAYALTVAPTGPKMKERKDGDGGPSYSQFFAGPRLPAKNTTMGQLAMGLQGLVLDRPVLDETGLTGAYDFNLSWTPDESQFSGRGGKMGFVGEPESPSLYVALEEQLGLRLNAIKTAVDVIIVDRAVKPTEN